MSPANGFFSVFAWAIQGRVGAGGGRLVVVALAWMLAGTAAAQTSLPHLIYISLPGIAGPAGPFESPSGLTVGNMFEVTQFSLSYSLDALPDGSLGKLPTVQFTASKPLDIVSPALAQNAAVETQFDPVQLLVRGVEFDTRFSSELFTFSPCTLTSLTVTTPTNKPFETFSMQSPVHVDAELASAGNVRTSAPACLYLDGVSSNSRIPNHTGWLPVDSFSFGIQNETKRSVTELVVTRQPDAGSVVLFNAVGGSGLANAVLDSFFNAADGTRVWYHLSLGTARVVGFAQSWDDPTSARFPVETLRLRVTGPLTWSYTRAPASTAGSDTWASSLDLQAWSSNHGPFALTATNFATATGIRDLDAHTAAITWPALAGATYTLLSSPALNGPYQTLTTVTSAVTAPFTVTVTKTANSFYRVKLPFD